MQAGGATTNSGGAVNNLMLNSVSNSSAKPKDYVLENSAGGVSNFRTAFLNKGLQPTIIGTPHHQFSNSVVNPSIQHQSAAQSGPYPPGMKDLFLRKI